MRKVMRIRTVLGVVKLSEKEWHKKKLFSGKQSGPWAFCLHEWLLNLEDDIEYCLIGAFIHYVALSIS